ncbi:hypothetical protein Hanom_Chr01g00018621 [Helianthus anomalus]
MPLIQVFVSQVMNLKPQLIDFSKEDEKMARLFTDMGDFYVELIATGMILDLLIIVNLQKTPKDNKARLVIHGFIKKVLYESNQKEKNPDSFLKITENFTLLTVKYYLVQVIGGVADPSHFYKFVLFVRIYHQTIFT